MKSSINVLMIDQAVTFGGSIVVAANIVNNPVQNIHYTVIYEIPKNIATTLFNKNVCQYRIKNIISYNLIDSIHSWITACKPKFIQPVLFKTFAISKNISNILQVIRISKIILLKRINIVHTNNSNEAIIAAKICRRKVVLHLHGIRNYDKDPLRNQVDGYISISKFVSTQAKKKGYNINKLVLMPNPVVKKEIDLQHSKFYKQKFKLLDNHKIFGIVGRVMSWKGHLEFLDAANIVLNKMDGVKALIIGDNSDGAEEYFLKVKEKISELGIKDKVIITGYISDIHNIMVHLNLLVHCSIQPEPFGLVITEAMSLGIPVIASNKGAPSEIVNDGETGYLVDPTNKEKMAEYIIQILSDNGLSKKMGGDARNDVFNRYSISNYTRNLSQFYQNIITNHSSD